MPVWFEEDQFLHPTADASVAESLLVPQLHVLAPVEALYVKVGTVVVGADDVATRFPDSLHAVVLLANSKEAYPSKVTAAKVGDASPFANLVAHSLATVAIVLVAADALAFLLMLVKDGIATAERIASTATTTTSSMREKPFSPDLLLRMRLVLGL